MGNLGARGTDEQFDAIARYIRRHLTMVDVNTATPDELIRLLQVPGSVADAIVERRRRRPFTDLADLGSVPGVDAAALEADRNRIRF
jgi:DNA uptake protein ComE-like DNA-binding protein